METIKNIITLWLQVCAKPIGNTLELKHIDETIWKELLKTNTANENCITINMLGNVIKIYKNV